MSQHRLLISTRTKSAHHIILNQPIRSLPSNLRDQLLLKYEHRASSNPVNRFHHSVRYGSAASGGSRTPIKLKINKKESDAGPRPGPDPGRLVNPDYLVQAPINLTSVPELTSSQITSSNVGKSFKFPKQTKQALEIFSTPSSIAASWKPMPEPVTILRHASVEFIERLRETSVDSQGKKPSVLTLIGEAGTGKSTILIQGLSHAIQSRWIVLYTSDAKRLTDGQYSYEYCPRTQTYHQNSLSSEILKQLSAANNLDGLAITKPTKLFGTKDDRTIDFEEEVLSGTPLLKFLQIGIQQVHLAPHVLDIALEELANQSTRPVLIAIDGAQNLFKPSDYVDGSFRQIDSFALSVPRLLLSFARGTKKLSKGVTILSSSSLHAPSKSLAWDTIINKGEPSIIGRGIWPGWKHYEDLIKPIQSFETLKVENLDRLEAIGVAQSLELSRLVLAPLDDRVFLRHFVCSSGNVREFTREIQNQIKL